ncbi:MAG: hypothetical protein KIS76_14105 [Pyrinomonadaceae bacterium]|nr:hypothetical protein [Pyrinomonadaceae bacterium]
MIKDRFEVEYHDFAESPQSDLDIHEKIINKRLSALSMRIKRIAAVLDKISDTDDPHLLETKTELISAREILVAQKLQYKLHSKRIDIFRLQSDIFPALLKLQELNDFEIEEALYRLDITKRCAKKIKHKLMDSLAEKNAPEVQFEMKSFLDQLTDTEKSCESLRGALLQRHASNALSDSEIAIESKSAPDNSEIAHEIETLNIQVALTDFAEKFDQLELEYNRTLTKDGN